MGFVGDGEVRQYRSRRRARRSMPSKIMASWAGSTWTCRSFPPGCGNSKVPRSRRFEYNAQPVRSNHNAFKSSFY